MWLFPNITLKDHKRRYRNSGHEGGPAICFFLHLEVGKSQEAFGVKWQDNGAFGPKNIRQSAFGRAIGFLQILSDFCPPLPKRLIFFAFELVIKNEKLKLKLRNIFLELIFDSINS